MLLVSALRPHELVDAVNQGGVPRLGVPPMGQVGAECLHGVRLWPAKCPFTDREGMNCTTVFPAASALSRSFNRSQWRQVGAAMADEGRVLFNAGITQSLFFTGPQLNIQVSLTFRSSQSLAVGFQRGSSLPSHAHCLLVDPAGPSVGSKQQQPFRMPVSHWRVRQSDNRGFSGIR